MSGRLLRSLAVAAVCSISAGCASYYQVIYPTTGAVFYTEQLDRQSSGSVILKDAKTGEEVTLASSAIRQIDKSEYEAALAAPAPAPAAKPSSPK